MKVTTHSKSMSRLARATIRAIGNGILPSGQVPVSPLASVSHVAALQCDLWGRDSRLRRWLFCSAGWMLDLKIHLVFEYLCVDEAMQDVSGHCSVL